MKSYSQAGQDIWVHDLIGDTGYFIDVGAHDGIVHSNTYALEQLGWTGICIEPNWGVAEYLRTNRTARVEQVAISDHGGTLGFDGVRVYDGPMDTPCTRLVDILDRNAAPPTIDYLSIDVEGHEIEVLAGMDFDRWHVRCITIEHNLYCDGPDRKNAIHDVLTGHGFERVRENVVAPGYGAFEDWFRNANRD